MKKIEQILSSGEAFRVDTISCMQHAEVIKSYSRPIEKFEWSHYPKPIQLVFKVAFVSICHQFNWDFLQGALAKNILDEPDIIEKISNTNSCDIEVWLKDYPKKERIRAKERAALLRNVGQVLKSDFKASPELFYNACSDTNLKISDLYKILDKFEGYRTDSLRKKSSVLTHDLTKEEIIKFKDESNLQPAIDYHIMRLYLRTGRVIPTNPAIFKFLKGAQNPRGTLVRQLRATVAEAESLTAYYSGLSVADVNYIEWQIGRSICLNNSPKCYFPEDHDVKIAKDILPICDGGCPYRKECQALNIFAESINFEEPAYISTDY